MTNIKYAIYYIAKGNKHSSLAVVDTLEKAEQKLAFLEKREEAGELEYLDDICQIDDSKNYQKKMDEQFAL